MLLNSIGTNNYMYKDYTSSSSTASPIFEKSEASENPSDSDEVEETPISLKQAIKDYWDEHISGLTDEEREKIEKLCEEYRKTHKIETEKEIESYRNFIKSLLKEFGFKGEIDDFIASSSSKKSTGGLAIENTKAPVSVFARTGCDLSSDSDPATSNKTEASVVTEGDGTRYILITTKTGQVFKLKIASEEVNNNPNDLKFENKDDGISKANYFESKISATYDSNMITY